MVNRVYALESNRSRPTREWTPGTRLTRNLVPVLDNEAGLAMSKVLGSLSLPARTLEQEEIRRENRKCATAILNARSYYNRRDQLKFYDNATKKYRALCQRKGLRVGLAPENTQRRPGTSLNNFLTPSSSLGARGDAYAKYLCGGYDTRSDYKLDFKHSGWSLRNSTPAKRAMARADNYRNDSDDGYSASESSDGEEIFP